MESVARLSVEQIKSLSAEQKEAIMQAAAMIIELQGKEYSCTNGCGVGVEEEDMECIYCVAEEMADNPTSN